jgi:hypothetical protein
MQYQSLDMERQSIFSAWCTDTTNSTRVSKNAMSHPLASRSPAPRALRFRFETPHGAKFIFKRQNTWARTPLQHFNPYSARQLHHCLQREHIPACLPNQAALSFRQAASELCVRAALPAHTTLVCSSLLLLQLLVTYALVRRKASSGMQRTCSDRAEHSLGPI